ncbi:unnamed protein product [Auanema sp. JU1783]|nr:unnamed protein product [Auanema sp. JU1783]
MFASNSPSDGPVLNAGSATANANIVSFFPSHSSSNQSHQSVTPTASAVIIRSPDSVTDGSANSDYVNSGYQLCSSASTGYQHYPPVQFPFLFGASEWSFVSF